MNKKQQTFGGLLEKNIGIENIEGIDKRLEYYKEAHNQGILTTNEIRKIEGLPPIEDDDAYPFG